MTADAGMSIECRFIPNKLVVNQRRQAVRVNGHYYFISRQNVMKSCSSKSDSMQATEFALNSPGAKVVRTEHR